MRNLSARRGFTLVELLVVISIITILMAILLPAVGAVREQQRRTQCSHNMKQIALAIQNYVTTWRTYPPGEFHGRTGEPGYTAWSGNGSHCSWDGQIGMWANLIYPSLELEQFYNLIDFRARPQYSNMANQREMQREVPMFHCPSDPYRGLTTAWGPGGETAEPQNVARIMNYFAVGGSTRTVTTPHGDGTNNMDPLCNVTNGIFYNDSRIAPSQILDGESQTAMLGETWGRVWPRESPEDVIPPGYPTGPKSRGMNGQAITFFDYPPNADDPRLADVAVRIPNMADRGYPGSPKSFHNGGINIAFCDGSVKFAANEIQSYPKFMTGMPAVPSAGVFQYLATINGEEVIDPAETRFH